jgi:hypothetical protein
MNDSETLCCRVLSCQGLGAELAFPGKTGKEKGPEPEFRAFCNFIPAATYVPTQLPVQYHRPSEA